MTLFGLLETSARRYRNDPAIFFGTELFATYGQLHAMALALAGGLATQTARGDRIVIQSENSPHLIPILFAVWAAGLVAVPVNAKLSPLETAEIAESCDARLILASAALAPALACASLRPVMEIGGDGYALIASMPAATPAVCRPTDPAWLFFTSGTTGRSKGAILSHRSLMAMCIAHLADFERLSPRDSLIHAAPMSHGSGLYVLPYIARGARHVIPLSSGFVPAELIELTYVHPGCGVFLAPTMVRRLRIEVERSGRRPCNLRSILYGGGPMYADEVVRAISCFGPILTQLYGQGEAPMTITGLLPSEHEDIELGMVGWPRSGVEVLIRDSFGNAVPSGQIGEITCRGDVTMTGYWNDDEGTREALRNGWLFTGDLGALDDRGRLLLAGRSKEVIISGGSNIYPKEIENVLISHEAVAEASVVGQSDPEWGEVVVAFIVCEQGAVVSAADLDSYFIERVARFKRPKRYLFISALPKSDNGKVLKRQLMQLL